jgi:hypothetical protein
MITNKKMLHILINDGSRDDTIYVFQDKEQASLFKETSIHFFIIDDIIIGIDSKRTYFDNYRFRVRDHYFASVSYSILISAVRRI